MLLKVRTEDLFEMLNALYTAFDELVDRHGVHKVDTIGDGEDHIVAADAAAAAAAAIILDGHCVHKVDTLTIIIFYIIVNDTY